jgi:hypothetical protein
VLARWMSWLVGLGAGREDVRFELVMFWFGSCGYFGTGGVSFARGCDFVSPAFDLVDKAWSTRKQGFMAFKVIEMVGLRADVFLC